MDSSQPSQLAQYIPVLMLLAGAIGFAVSVLALSVLLGKFGKTTKAKDMAYECGANPIGEGGARFSVKFHLVAMLFILFDIEAIFLYPWAVVYRDLKWFGFVEMLVFVVLILSGFFYIWKKGALDWSQKERGAEIKRSK
jgi:NADH-quinone oxidoreductase subunit A